MLVKSIPTCQYGYTDNPTINRNFCFDVLISPGLFHGLGYSSKQFHVIPFPRPYSLFLYFYLTESATTGILQREKS